MGISCALTWTTTHKGCSSTDRCGGKRRGVIAAHLMDEHPQSSSEQGSASDISTTAAAKILSRAVNDLTESFIEIG
jgi:hypothetical protein